MKKLISVMLGAIIAAAVVVAIPASVKAQGMPCTEATLKQFQDNLAAAKQELAVAEATKAQADANVVALRAQGATGLELLVATDAATNAANIVAAYKGKVANCEASVNNIASRGATEQYYLDMEDKWKERAKIDSIGVQLEGAKQITSAALTQYKNMQAELLKQQNNAATNPAYAASLAVIQQQTQAAEAIYLARKAESDALAAQYAQLLNTLNFATDADNAAYDAFVRAYGANMRDPKAIGDVRPNEWSIRWFE